MNKRSPGDIIAIVFGVILGIFVLLFRTIWRFVGGKQESAGETAGMSEQARQAFADARERSEDVIGDAKQRADDLLHRGGDAETSGEQVDFGFPVEPDPAAGEETVVQGASDAGAELTDRQHGSLGGIPQEPDEQTTFISRDESVQTPSDFAYGSGVSDEGVEVTQENDTERGGDAPLDEGIPNLGEPGDVDARADQAEDSIETVDDDFSEDFGQSAPTDSRVNGERWVGDTGTQADEIPGASRGLADDNEVAGAEADIEDTDDSEEVGLYDDVAPSGAGGEIDLENDESPAFDESEMSVVESPDDPVAVDGGGPQDDELTLGLRDSETADAGAGDQSGLTAEYDLDQDNDDIEAIVDPDEEARERYLTGDAAEPDVPSRNGDEHLGKSGDFDEAEETETIPAAPTGDEADAANDDTDRDPFVTGDEADDASEADPDETDIEDVTPENARGAYSAAWSSPAGLIEEEAPEPPRAAVDDEDDDGELRPMDDVTQPDDSGISRDVGGDDLADAGIDSLTDEDDDVGDAVDDAGPSEDGAAMSRDSLDSPVDTSAGIDVVGDDASEEASTPIEAAEGNEADLASASAGDLGTTTGTDRPVTPEEAAEQASGAGQRQSRRERRKQSDWVPAGAVRGDGSVSCPADYPIKGNANSRIYHRPTDDSYPHTKPEYCFATEEDAQQAGFRAPKGR